jgi:hypothetical protein
MTDIATLIDPTCGLRDYDRIVPIKPLSAGETSENYNQNIMEQSKQRSEVIRCAYFSAGLGLIIIAIIIIIIIFVYGTQNKPLIILGIFLVGGFLVFISGWMAGRKYDVEQTIFNDMYKDTNWDKKEATRLYNKRKEAELERQAKLEAARIQADAFRQSQKRPQYPQQSSDLMSQGLKSLF